MYTDVVGGLRIEGDGCAEGAQVGVDVLVAAHDVVSLGDGGGAVCGETREDEGSAAAQVV